jgi:hypothetical protein
VEVPVVLSDAYAYVLFDNISIDVYLVENKRTDPQLNEQIPRRTRQRR